MDPHANHVVQRAIELMRPGAIPFVLSELLDHKKGIPDLARHRYGCRVLERVIEHFPQTDLSGLIDKLLCESKNLIGHPFGHFVMQHLLEYGAEHHKSRLVSALSASDQDLRWVC